MLLNYDNPVIFDTFSDALTSSDLDKVANVLLYVLEANGITIDFLTLIIRREIYACGM